MDASSSASSFWKEKLQNLPSSLLQPEWHHSSSNEIHTQTLTLTLPHETTLLLDKIHNPEEVTRIILAAFYALLHRYGIKECCICYREKSDILPLILNLEGDMSLREFVLQLTKVITESRAHPFPSSPLAILPDALGDFCFGVQEPRIVGLTFGTRSHADLQLTYNDYVIPTNCALKMAHHLQIITSAFIKEYVTNPEYRIADLPLLTDNEKILLATSNATQCHSEDETLFVHELFSRNAKAHPQHTAIVFHNKDGSTDVCSYEKLEADSSHLAEHLFHAGIKPGLGVGIIMNRSIELIIAVLATLKAGGIVIPLDAAMAPLTQQIEETRPLIFLTNKASETLVTSLQKILGSTPVINITVATQKHHAESLHTFKTTLQQTDPAYICYTSGSKGKPKGVMISHRSFTNLALELLHERAFKPETRFLCTAPQTFDAFFLEITEALIVPGSQIHMIYGEGRLSGEKMGKIINQFQLNVITLLPNVLATLFGTDSDTKTTPSFPSLYDITSMGSAPNKELISSLLELGIRIRNEYGPTEATVCSTRHLCQPEEPHTCIGHPIRNVQIYLVDEHGNECPPGIIGKMLIGGISLAMGYLHNAELTRERFKKYLFNENLRQFRLGVTTHPSSYEMLLYDTEDYAYRTDTGSIVFSHSSNTQMKLDGAIRFDTRRIQEILEQHPGLLHVAIKPIHKTQGFAVFAVPKNKARFSLKELNTYLHEAGIQPTVNAQHLEFLTELPVTSHDKVDLDQLIITEENIDKMLLLSTHNPLQQLKLIWAKILGISTHQIVESHCFADLGGTSIKLAKLESEINHLFQLNPSMSLDNLLLPLNEMSTLLMHHKLQYAKTPSPSDANNFLLLGSSPFAEDKFFRRNPPTAFKFDNEEHNEQ